VLVAELRAVLLFHGSISAMSWHPSIPETLLIRCEGDQYDGLVFVWDPLSEGPRSVDFAQHLPRAKTAGKWRALWLGLDASCPPSLFLSDAQNYLLASLTEPDQETLPWDNLAGSDIRRAESPLELVPAEDAELEALDVGEEDNSELEDTFVHKR